MQEKPETKTKTKKLSNASKSISRYGPKTESPRLSDEEQEQLNLQLVHSSSDVAEINRLIRAGADIESTDIGGNTVLHTAASGGYTDSCSTILSKYAEAGGDVKRLIEKANFAWNNSLHMAAFWGRTDICALILTEYVKSGGDAKKLIDEKNEDGETALTGGAYISNDNTAKFLSQVRILSALTKAKTMQFLQDFKQCVG